MTAPDGLAVLAVDDEPQALKYLPGILGRPCRCACSAAEARRLLGEDPAGFAVVLCDQRMPGETGVEFLAWMRREHPGCVRILCTAYADITAAIAAVNDGAVFQFVLKPWQPESLRSLVGAAIAHFALQRDRDRLLRERLDLLQRQLAADRVRHLATAATALAGRLRRPLLALRAFLAHCPAIPAPDPEDRHLQWGDLRELALHDCQRTLTALDRLIGIEAMPPARFGPLPDLDAMVATAIAGQPRLGCTIEAPGAWPPISGDAGLLARMFSILAERLADPAVAALRLSVGCQAARLRGGAAGIRIRFRLDGGAWTDRHRDALFGRDAAAPGLLLAYVIAFHHGGSLALPETGDAPPCLEVELPLDPAAGGEPEPGWPGRMVALPDA